MDRLEPIEFWLVDFAKEGARQQHAARRILSMLIRVAKRTGHTPDLNTERMRQLVRQAAHVGLLPSVRVPCSVCGTSALLIDWELLADSSLQQHRAMIVDASSRGTLPTFGFLLRCAETVDTRQAAPPGGPARIARDEGDDLERESVKL